MCPICRQGFAYRERLDAHTTSASHHPCRQCNQQFCHESRLRQHIVTEHYGGGGVGESTPVQPADLDEPIVGRTPYQDSAEYEDLLFEHRGAIRSQETNKSNWRCINRQIAPDYTYRDLKCILNEVINSEKYAFKINLAFSIVLYHTVE